MKEVSFSEDLRKFPDFVFRCVAGLAHEWLTSFESLALFTGSLFVTSRKKLFRSIGVYLLLWVYFKTSVSNAISPGDIVRILLASRQYETSIRREVPQTA